MQQQQTYLTTEQVLQRYHASVSTLWRWENDIAVPFPRPLRLGRRKLYDLADLITWERARSERLAS